MIKDGLTYRSYAVVVLKDMTNPRITPSTVKSWLLTASFVLESLSMSATTGGHKIARLMIPQDMDDPKSTHLLKP